MYAEATSVAPFPKFQPTPNVQAAAQLHCPNSPPQLQSADITGSKTFGAKGRAPLFAKAEGFVASKRRKLHIPQNLQAVFLTHHKSESRFCLVISAQWPRMVSNSSPIPPRLQNRSASAWQLHQLSALAPVINIMRSSSTKRTKQQCSLEFLVCSREARYNTPPPHSATTDERSPSLRCPALTLVYPVCLRNVAPLDREGSVLSNSC